MKVPALRAAATSSRRRAAIGAIMARFEPARP